MSDSIVTFVTFHTFVKLGEYLKHVTEVGVTAFEGIVSIQSALLW